MKIASLVLAMFVVVGCSSSLTGPEVRQVTGTVLFGTVEGGYFHIMGDDSVLYTPTNKLVGCYEQDGLRVQATLRIEKDLMSYVPGTLVHVESIQSVPASACLL